MCPGVAIPVGIGFHFILHPDSFQDNLKIFFGGQVDGGLKIRGIFSPLLLVSALTSTDVGFGLLAASSQHHPDNSACAQQRACLWSDVPADNNFRHYCVSLQVKKIEKRVRVTFYFPKMTVVI